MRASAAGTATVVGPDETFDIVSWSEADGVKRQQVTIGATGWAVLAALDINPFVGRKGQATASSKDGPCPPK